ncbi:hypothetical protein T439DRAFT_186524 [Meredithblackwellia eburnea MCA 4105]
MIKLRYSASTISNSFYWSSRTSFTAILAPAHLQTRLTILRTSERTPHLPRPFFDTYSHRRMSTVLKPRQCCVSGVVHEGIPTGTVENIGGIDTYVSLPPAEASYDNKLALLLLPNVFGMQLINTQLVADSFASNGFATYIPDYLNGDPATPESIEDGTFDLDVWLKSHGPKQTRPPLDAVIRGLIEERRFSTFAAIGYCIGARYTIDLAIEGKLKAGVVTHPSLISVPEDFEAIKAHVTAPLLWNLAGIDELFTSDMASIGDRILGGTYQCESCIRIDYPNCEHGFAIRGDLSIPLVKESKERAFRNTVDFLRSHFCHHLDAGPK